jgi:hypothetical protein
MVRRRQSKNRRLISKTSNVAESGNRSSSALVIEPVPAPNSTAMRVRSNGSGSSMAFAKYLELGEIAPTMGKLASASPINILRLMGSYRRDTSPGIASCSSSSQNAPRRMSRLCPDWRRASEPGLLPLGSAGDLSVFLGLSFHLRSGLFRQLLYTNGMSRYFNKWRNILSMIEQQTVSRLRKNLTILYSQQSYTPIFRISD